MTYGCRAVKIVLHIVTILAALLLTPSQTIAETKAEVDLKKQLAAARLEIDVRDTHIKLLQDYQKKLTDAVAVETHTTQENSKKIQAVTDRITKSEADGKKLVDTVRSQAAASENATTQLVDEVKTTNLVVKSAISAQAKQQDHALAVARDVARKLEVANTELARARQEDVARLGEMQKSLDDIKIHDDLNAAKDESARNHDRQQTYREIAIPIGSVVLALVVLLQIMAGRQQRQTHDIVNGRFEALVADNKQLKERLESNHDSHS